MIKREMSKWLEDSVKKERERCARIEEFKIAGLPFMSRLKEQLRLDMSDFEKAFPGYKVEVKEGTFWLRVTATDWIDPTPSVNVQLNLMKRCLLIQFSDRTELNTEMSMEIINGLAEFTGSPQPSASELSRYCLSPILFPALIHDEVLNRHA